MKVEPLMLLWGVLAALTLASLFVIVRPFLRGHGMATASSPASDLYRAQLAELRRAADAGTLSAAEAEEARREIGRRLIAADEAERAAKPVPWRNEAAAGLALAGIVPLVALAAYVFLGRPGLPGAPLAERNLEADMRAAPVEEVAEKLFQRLAMDPGHADGWALLARTYMKMERFDEAAAAYGRALELEGANAPASLWSAYGEALTLAAGGRVTPDAKGAFENALKKDAKDEAARFYSALAKSQGGDIAGAKADLQALLNDLPADAPQRRIVEAKLAELDAPPVTENPMVRNMVANLAAKLEADPHNLDGWLLLMTSYVKLGEMDNAKAALATARTTFKDDTAALEAIAAKARELGLEP